MKFSVDKKDKYCVFKLEEEKLLSSNAPKLKSEFVLLNTEGYRNIICDLSAVDYIDSSGLSAILIGNRLCKEAGGTYVLTGLNEAVSKLIKISQLESILNIVPSMEESVDFIMMEELERDLKG